MDLDGTTVARVRGDEDNPASRGYICPKGRALGAWHHHPNRLDVPTMGGRPGSWTDVLDDAGERLRTILADGNPNAVGFYLGNAGQFDTLAYAAASGFIQAVGTASRYSTITVDSPSVLLAAEAIAGFPMLLPGPDTDAKFVLWLGGNPVVSHGHGRSMSMPIQQLRKWATEGQLWIVDPRRTETAELATRHLAIRPGTDHALLAYLVRELLDQGADYEYLADRADGIDAVRDAVAPYTLDRAMAETGLAQNDLKELVAAIRSAGRIAVKESTGISFQAAANVCMWLIWVLNIITNSHDRPGGTYFNPGIVQRLHRRTWPHMDGTPAPGPASRPELPSRLGEYPCVAVADEIEAGNLRALIVVGGNPITAFPQPRRLAGALRKLDLLIVSDVVSTATTELATHVLPATGQLERADVWPVDFINISEANQYAPAAVPAGGERRATWWQLAQLAARVGHTILPGGVRPDDATEEQLLRAVVESTGGDFDRLVQATHGVSVEPRHFGWVEDTLPNGRWQLAFQPFIDQLAELSARHAAPGLRLIPSRQRRHLNSQLADGVGARNPDRPYALINPADAGDRGIPDGSRVVVSTPHGSLQLTARYDDRLPPGAVSVPHGFAEANVGELTSDRDDVDILGGMPTTTALPVEVVLARD